MEDYAARFDDLFFNLAQRRGFREYLAGLLAPRERNKTITCLAGAEPVAGAGMPGVQRLQFFLSESPWEVEQVNDRRLELLREESATAPHDGGVIVIDDSGDRKDGTKTAHVGRQWLGRLGKTDNGIVTVTTVWTDGRVYYPLHATPYTPAHHFARSRSDPAFRTKPQLAAALAARGKEAGFGCRAVVADCAYSVSDDWYLALREAGLAYVVALKPHRGTWAPAHQPHTPIEAAHALTWKDAKRPGDWTPVERHFRDGHTETWWAELCIERPGQLSLREPSGEGVDGISSGGVLRKPQIQVFLAQVRECELVLVEPVQQGGSDVAAVGCGGAGGVAPAFRSAACVLDDVPFREGADDPGLVRGQGFEGGSRPELESGEGLVAFGAGSGRDEVVPDVACDGALRQPVEEFMGLRQLRDPHNADETDGEDV
ncbi:transposase [Streptomyces mirabilis]